MKKLIILVLAMVLFLTLGCSSFRSHTQPITVNCSQPDAKIYVNGKDFAERTETKTENIKIPESTLTEQQALEVLKPYEVEGWKAKDFNLPVMFGKVPSVIPVTFVRVVRDKDMKTVTVPRNRNVTVECRKTGYQNIPRVIGYHFNETGVLDVLGTILFLVPAIGLATPGAWSLDETTIDIEMLPVEK